MDEWKSKTQSQHQIDGISFNDNDDDSGDGEKLYKVPIHGHMRLS